MAARRSDVVRKGEAGVYHCYSRCVRRAFLMGGDQGSGRNYDHRRQWFVRRLEALADVFAIDINFFSVLSNHFHLVLRTCPRRVKMMGNSEVARRWLMVFSGKRNLTDEIPEPSQEQIDELVKDKKKMRRIRKRLSNVSWFMGALKEYIARRANREDECKGAFWEKRFGCRAVRGEHGLLVVGLYTDLNLVRAGEVSDPLTSSFCSAGLRNKAANGDADWLSELTLAEGQDPDGPSKHHGRATDRGTLEMPNEEYERILAGLVMKESRKRIPPDLVRQFEQRTIDAKELFSVFDNLSTAFPKVVGDVASIRSHAEQVGRRWFHGLLQASRLFTV